MLEVGQKLWYVPRDKRQGDGHEVEVLKVGRKWAQISYWQRVDVNTLDVDGGQYMSPAQCYLSREEWELKRDTDNAWYRFVDDVARRRPGGVTLGKIKQARAALGMADTE